MDSHKAIDQVLEEAQPKNCNPFEMKALLKRMEEIRNKHEDA
jgi:hypothetical protein